ncbi:putative uncharacterized transmembrane protein DDB_G0293028 [Sander lucioperca]|uniref:putative uncharacterized transmembrane protein DDB_G0293028 n=1 Tax=Sander lucioperca TaxID=283035 RepID=UPI001653C4FD|nr:putative uncharacterized transmembrane protein DDB_G0293028 [Sander lucioperca]
MIHEKMVAKRIARMALAEIRAFLAEEEEKKEAAWELKMKTLEDAQEQLREERRREAERQRIEKEKAEKERVEKEKAERERIEKEKAERERMEKEKAEKERIREGET